MGLIAAIKKTFAGIWADPEDNDFWLIGDSGNRPPQAYSINHPNFSYEIGKRLLVKINGEEIDKVVAYDCRDGWVQYWHLRDIIRETGKVTVEWRDE